MKIGDQVSKDLHRISYNLNHDILPLVEECVDEELFDEIWTIFYPSPTDDIGILQYSMIDIAQNVNL